jgi:outer membrane protein OmpA-like peptidoglycan-associated protein
MSFGDTMAPPIRVFATSATRTLRFFFLLTILAGVSGAVVPVEAQPFRAGNTFYVKFGGGLSDYAGGNNGTLELDNTTELEEFFDTRKFTDGEVFPYMLAGEVGYQFSPAWSLGLGYQFGQYPFVSGVPFTTTDGLIGRGGDLGTARHTIQLLGRYMVGAKGWIVSPYLDTGVNASFGGLSPGIGPLIGAGLDVSLSGRTSLFLEGRVNITFDDEATDGIDGGDPFDALSALPSIGVKHTFSRPAVPPRIIALEGPAEVEVGESATFAARVNEAKALRPLTYRWAFGDGRTASGRTASHVYNQPGTYDVVFTARNGAGQARDSLSVEVPPPPRPARIRSVNATPNPAEEGGPVRFESTVEGASPITYEWTFGDGETGTGASPTHTYEEPGQYPVRLVASNQDGEDRDSLIVRVERVLPAICETVREFNSVYFSYGSSDLTEEAEQKLQENVDVLRKCPNLSVRVEGFAASDEPNGQALSEARARTVADFYNEEGVAPTRLRASGEGSIEGQAGKKGDASRFRRVDTIPLSGGAGGAQPEE